MKTFNLLPIILILITPLFLTSQTKIDSEVRSKVRSTSLNQAFEIINDVAKVDRDYVFKPDSIKVSVSLNYAQPDNIEVVAIMAIKWANSNVKEMNIDYMNPAIPD